MASDAALERSTLRKAALRLLPLMGLGYGIAFMDRVNISFAALQMNRDLHFSASVYGLGAGLFFISYAALEIPSNLILARVGARRWIARIMFTWGVIAVGMMFVRTPWQFYVMRFLLGAAEAGFFPGVIYHLTLWFPAQHRGRAISRFYVAGPLASAFMGAVAGSLLGLEGRLSLSGWQWLFLVQGIPAILMSLLFLLYLPDTPATAKWLSSDEKRWLETGLAADHALTRSPGEHNTFKALRDPRVLAFVALNFMTLGAYYAFNLSAPSVLETATGLSAGRIGFFVSIAGLMGAAAMIFNGWHSDLRRERYLHLAAPLLIQAACFAVMASTHAPVVMLGAYMILITANWAAAAVIWLIPGEILDPRSVAVAVAGINGIGQLGSFVMPYAWGLARDATGDFHTGLAALTAPYLIAGAIVLVLRQGHRRRLLTVAPAA
ncbi:MFS transporter [Phenylobacterium sp.]|uniref:MFS transporter n=1 Tax=Phenylobacterium sp. TaxID=1871053 RepID=UPI002F403CBB